MKVAADPELMRKKAIGEVSEAAKEALSGMTFVITGITEELEGEDFGEYVRGIIEASGGVVRSAVSGKTDYLVCGTIHANP